MLRLDIHANRPAVAAYRVDNALLCTALAQQLGRLDTVLLRPLLEINVMQQTDNAPEFRVIAALLRKQRMTPSTVNACRKWNGSALYLRRSSHACCLVILQNPFWHFQCMHRMGCPYQFCSQLGFSRILTPAAMPSAANMVTIDVPP